MFVLSITVKSLIVAFYFGPQHVNKSKSVFHLCLSKLTMKFCVKKCEIRTFFVSVTVMSLSCSLLILSPRFRH